MPNATRQTNIARDFKARLFISKTFRSEVQSDLGIDATITGARTAAAGTTKTSKRTTQPQRLTKIRRRQVPDRRAQIHAVENVLEVNRHVQIVSLLTRSSRATTLRTWPTRPNSLRRRSSNWSRSGGSCGSSVTPVDIPKSKCTTDTKISDKRAWRLSEVTRHDRLAGQRRQVEITETSTPDIRRRTIRVWTSKTRALIDLTIEVAILSGRDVESGSGIRDDERIQHHFPPRQVNSTEDRKPVSNIKRATPKLA